MPVARVITLAILLLASPLLWRFGSGIYEDWSTIDVTNELIKHRSGSFKTLVAGDRVCVFPPSSFVVAIASTALPAYGSNRFRSPQSDSGLWYLVRIDDRARRFDVYTVENQRAPLALNSLGALVGLEGFSCPCSRDLKYEIRNTNAAHDVIVYGATEDICSRG